MIRRVIPLCCAGILWLASSLVPVSAITIVIDFKQPGEATTTDIIGGQTAAVDLLQIGSATQRNSIDIAQLPGILENEIIVILNRIFAPAQTQLTAGVSLNFISGDIGGVAPTDSYWYLQIGDRADTLISPVVGHVAGRSIGPQGDTHNQLVSSIVGSVFTNTLIGNSASSPLSQSLADELGDAWIMAMANTIAGTAAHEIGHALSLEHPNDIPFGQPPIAFPACNVNIMLTIADYDERCRQRERQLSASNIVSLVSLLNQPATDALILGDPGPIPLIIEAEAVSLSATAVSAPSSLLLLLLTLVTLLLGRPVAYRIN